MSAIAAQRLVPIRPSPQKVLAPKTVTVFTTAASPTTTLTPPKTGTKRKLSDPSPEPPVKCKRRINFGVSYVVSPQPPVAVARRNARERNRVKQVNNGFATLRQHIPGAAKAKKISKVETLKQAVDYIRSLQMLLEEHDSIMNKSNNMSPALTSLPNDQNCNTTYTTVINSDPSQTNLMQRNIQLPGYYYSENVSPLSSAMYPMSVSSNASAVSPACSDQSSTLSPVHIYVQETPQPQMTQYIQQCQTTIPQQTTLDPTVTTVPSYSPETPFTVNNSYDPNLDAYSGPIEEDDLLLDAIANWQECH